MRTIISKEILDHLQSVQFMVLLIISIILFFANGAISVKKYHQQIAQYNKQVMESIDTPSTIMTALYKKPNPMLFLAEGGDKFQPHGYTLKPKGVLSVLPSGPRNFKLPEFPEADWSFIIKIIFSLYVLLLGYHAVSGEKAQGTLRLALSNSIGRIKFLIAKFCAILLTVLVPLIIGILINLIIIGIFIPHVFSFTNIIKILILIILGIGYLSIFVFLSLLFSSLIHQPSLVLLMLLAIWVVFTIIIPNVSGILSRTFSNVPSEFQTAKQVGPMIQQQVWSKIDEIRKKVQQGEFKTEQAVLRETDRAFDEGQQDLIKHYNSYDNAMKQQARIAQNLSRLSPTALFQYAAENIAGSGMNREEQFLKDAQAFSTIYDNYILEKVGKLVGTSMWTFGTTFEINGKPVHISSPQPEEYQGDKSDFPRFEESKPSIVRSLKNALLDLAGLILWNLVLAVLAFAAFIRCDIR